MPGRVLAETKRKKMTKKSPGRNSFNTRRAVEKSEPRGATRCKG